MFVSWKLIRMNIRIYSNQNLATNEYANIFVSKKLTRMNIQIYLYPKNYTNEYPNKYLDQKYSNIRIYLSHSDTHTVHGSIWWALYQGSPVSVVCHPIWQHCFWHDQSGRPLYYHRPKAWNIPPSQCGSLYNCRDSTNHYLRWIQIHWIRDKVCDISSLCLFNSNPSWQKGEPREIPLW